MKLNWIKLPKSEISFLLVSFVSVTKGEQVDANGGGSSLDKLNVSSASITLGLPVGKGRFGDVHQGYLKGNPVPQKITKIKLNKC